MLLLWYTCQGNFTSIQQLLSNVHKFWLKTFISGCLFCQCEMSTVTCRFWYQMVDSVLIMFHDLIEEKFDSKIAISLFLLCYFNYCTSGVTSHRQPRQSQGPKMVKWAQSDQNYVSRLLARSKCLLGGPKIIVTPLYCTDMQILMSVVLLLRKPVYLAPARAVLYS